MRAGGTSAPWCGGGAPVGSYRVSESTNHRSTSDASASLLAVGRGDRQAARCPPSAPTRMRLVSAELSRLHAGMMYRRRSGRDFGLFSYDDTALLPRKSDSTVLGTGRAAWRILGFVPPRAPYPELRGSIALARRRSPFPPHASRLQTAAEPPALEPRAPRLGRAMCAPERRRSRLRRPMMRVVGEEMLIFDRAMSALLFHRRRCGSA